MDRTGVDCLLSGFIEIFLMMFQTKIIKPDVGDRTNNTRETARAGLSTTKCDLKRIPDLETAIREGIDSGEAVGFDPEDHLQTLKARRANG